MQSVNCLKINLKLKFKQMKAETTISYADNSIMHLTKHHNCVLHIKNYEAIIIYLY